MNDHEMTMLCAAALGLDFSNEDSHGNAGQHVFYYNKYGVLTEFDPLCNDAQAMALVRHLKLAVAYELGHWEAWNHLDNSHPSHIVGGDEDLNRAIVECVAKDAARAIRHSYGSRWVVSLGGERGIRTL